MSHVNTGGLSILNILAGKTLSGIDSRLLCPSAKTILRSVNHSSAKHRSLRKLQRKRMSKTVHIGSKSQFDSLLQSSKIVVADCKRVDDTQPYYRDETQSTQETLLICSYTVYADWCGPCKQIAPIYEQLSAQLSRPDKITFAKVNTEQQREVAQQYLVTA